MTITLMHNLINNKYLIIVIGAMALSMWPFILLVQFFILRFVRNFLFRLDIKLLKTINYYKVLHYALHIFIILYLFSCIHLLRNITTFHPIINALINKLLEIYLIIICVTLLLSLGSVFVDTYETYEIAKRIPIRPHVQILKILICFCAFVFFLSSIFNISPSTFFASLGAATALLVLVFKDTILGFLASFQLILNDMVHIGDVVAIPLYAVDGCVEEISLTTVKVRNFDKSISTIPTYSLLTTSMKNFRNIADSSKRRIKRLIYIKPDTIKFCSEKLLSKINQLSFSVALKDQYATGLTNLGVFRLYITEYLKKHQSIQQQSSDSFIKQLEMTDHGLPIEIYLFTNNMDLVQFEITQSEIFEYIFALLPAFELSVFNG